MRTLRKRLTVVNRGDESKNVEAMRKVRERYVNKMEQKGWRLIDREYAGNSMFCWEHILRMCK